MGFNHRFTRRRLMVTSAAAAGGALIGKAGFAPGTVAAQDATPAAPLGGIVRMAFLTPATLNPLFSTAGTDQGVERQIYGALVMMTHESAPQLDLAAAIDATPDALSYTFTLAEGLAFSDGVPLTSADVAFTFERAINPQTGSFWRSRFLNIQGAEEYTGEGVEAITGIVTPDAMTVTHNLINPDATWLTTLGDFAGFCIVPMHIFGEIAAADLQNSSLSLTPSAGAGAFTFGEYQADQFISINRNDAYNPPKANIDQLLLNILPQSVTAMSQLEAGEIDLLAVSIPDMEIVEANPNLTLSAEPSIQLRTLVPNLSRPAFADKRVRQAMHYALDREGLASELYRGYANVINSPFFAWEWEDGQAPVPNAYPYDPDVARSLLADAGWSSDQFQIQMHYIPGNPFDDSLVNIIQQQYADVGINYDLVQVDVTEYTNRIVSGAPADGSATGDFDLLLLTGGVMGAEPNITARYFDTASKVPFGANYAHFSNARVDELYIQGRATTDIESRKAIYQEIASILNDEAVWIYLFQLYAIYGVNNRLKGFTPPGHPGRVISSAHNWWVEE
jgi:peptide/nickel transport system substrate-binding protein